MARATPEKAAKPPSVVPSPSWLGSMPPWMSFVARIVIWVGFAVQPESAKAATQPIIATSRLQPFSIVNFSPLSWKGPGLPKVGPDEFFVFGENSAEV